MSLDERMVVERIERLSLRELRVWLKEDLVRPAQGEQGPVFDELDVARLRLLCDLKKEMELPSQALPVVLELIDQMHTARRELRLLAEALDEQPPTIRRKVLARLRTLREGS